MSYIFLKVKDITIKNVPNIYPYSLLVDSIETAHEISYMHSKHISSEYFKLKESRIKNERCHPWGIEQKVIDLVLQNHENRQSVKDDLEILSDSIMGIVEKNFIKYGKPILVRSNNSWMIYDPNIHKIIDRIEKEELIFPEENHNIDKAIKSLNITKWDGGSHFYARIFDREDVFELDEKKRKIYKWDTEEEARKKALEFYRKKV